MHKQYNKSRNQMIYFVIGIFDLFYFELLGCCREHIVIVLLTFLLRVIDSLTLPGMVKDWTVALELFSIKMWVNNVISENFRKLLHLYHDCCLSCGIFLTSSDVFYNETSCNLF